VILTSKTVAPEERERLTPHVAHLAANASFSRADFVELVPCFCGERPGVRVA
jgi:hypothetical protein